MNKLEQLKITLIVFAVLLLTSCKKENSCDCFKRTGSIVNVNREVSGFDKLFVEDNLNVFITQGSVFEVKIESGDNLISLIKTEVVDGTLFIRNKNRCNWTRSYDKPFNVYVTMPVLNFLTSDGTGKIRSLNTITTPDLDIQIKNSGDIELVINNSKITSHMHGSGDLTLHGHTSEHVYAHAKEVAELQGYEGDPCRECGQFTMVRNGACLKCDSCGGTSGCS